MKIDLPPNAPKTTGEAFAYVGNLHKGATLDDLRILAMVEAVGLELYENLARQTDNPEVQALLRENGREEMKHAHRLSKAIEILTGEPFPIPALGDIPFYTPLDPMPVTKESLSKLAEAEFAGEDLYKGVASGFDNPEALELFRLNGKEEVEHGGRLMKAAALLSA